MQFARVKTLIAAALPILIGQLLAGSAAELQRPAARPVAGKADAGAPDAGSPMPVCIRVSSDSRYRNGGYDHIVAIDNRCERAASCEVTTNVNPDTIRVRVGARSAVEVLTFRGSPAYAFTARVRCKLDA